MKIYTGNDICELERIEKAYKKFGERFLKKTFTENEQLYCLSNQKLRTSRLAVRFAVKEAVSKALGVGINKLGWNKGINWKDVEVIRGSKGEVSIKLTGKAKTFEKELEITDWSISVSHSQTNALATVIGYKA